MKRSKLSRNVLVLGFVSFLNDASSEMIYPLLPIFLTNVLGAGAGFVGLIEGIAESTASLLKLVSGWFSDRMRMRKGIVAMGYALAALSRPFIAMASFPWQVLVVRFADRVGKGVRTAPREALVADSTPKKEDLGLAFGYHRAMDHAGAVVGPLLASGLLHLFLQNWGLGRAEGYRYLFWLAAIPGIISIFAVLAGVSEIKPDVPASAPALSLAPFGGSFKFLLLVVILFTLGNSSDAFLLLRAQMVGVHVALIPILWLCLHLIKMASSIPGGIISDRIGRKRVIMVGWLIYAIVYFGFARAHSAIEIWIWFLVYGLFYGLTEGVERALVADLVPQSLRGTAYGVYNFAIGVAAFPASVLAGILWQEVSPGVAFSFGAIMALTAALLFGLFFREKPCRSNLRTQ